MIDIFGLYLQAQQQGELPAAITAGYGVDNNSKYPDGSPATHGTACAEIIYDMAPGVQFTFVSPRTPTEMASLITQLAASGHKIISSSIGWQQLEPGDGSGPMNDAIRYAYEQYGTLYVQAAGNEAQHHWVGQFSDQNGDNWHEFAPNQSINWIGWNAEEKALREIPKGTSLNVNLRWNGWPTTNQDYNLHIVQWKNNQAQLIGSSANRQVNGVPIEGISNFVTPEDGYYGIAIQRWLATGSEILDLSGHFLPDFQFTNPYRSLIDAASSPYALTVAAVDVNTLNLEPYSSWGPTFGPGGTLADGYTKPNISGFANVDTWAWSSNDPFSGTSAATPHVAGAAALVWQAYPGEHASAIWNNAVGFAVDRGTEGFDYSYGAGILHMMDPPSTGGTGQTPPGQGDAPATKIQHKIHIPFAMN